MSFKRFNGPFYRGPPPPPDIKQVGFGVESEVKINYKKIKWTPCRKATQFLPGV